MRGVSVGSINSRLEALSMPEPNSGCLIWIGHAKKNGYGTLATKRGGRWTTMLAHRVSYETHIGPIPNGKDLDHKCRVRCCINPAHLEPVSRSENLDRSPIMNRQTDKTHCPRGHSYSGVNTRGQRVCSKCLAAAAMRYRKNRKSR